MPFNLPDNYEVPQNVGNYMRFEQGDNKFRILDSPIVGWEGWITNQEGNNEPRRFRMDNKPSRKEVSSFNNARLNHFWAMPVWNYEVGAIQILQVTQKTIQTAIENLIADEEWGDPTGYDIKVKKTGEKLETEYNVSPSPHSDIDENVQEMYEEMEINLDALYTNDDPFEANQDDVEEDDISVDDLPDF